MDGEPAEVVVPEGEKSGKKSSGREKENGQRAMEERGG